MNSELTGRNQGVPDAFSFTQPTFFIYSVPADDSSSYHSEMSTYTYPEITHEPCDNGTDSFHFSYFHNGWCNTTIDLTIGEVANRYTIRLYAKDHAGNSITASLSKAWDAVKSAVDWIKDWLKGEISRALDDLLGSFSTGSNNYAINLGNVLILAENEYNQKGELSSSTIEKIRWAFTGTTFTTAELLSASVLVVLTSIMIFTAGLSTLLSILFGFLLSLLISNIMKGYEGSDTGQKIDIGSPARDLGSAFSGFLEAIGVKLDPVVGLFTFLLSVWSTFLAGVSLVPILESSVSDPTGYASAYWCLVFSFIAGALSFANIFIQSVWLFTLAMSFMALIFGFFALKGATDVAKWAGGIGFGFTAIAILATVADMQG